jgi:hypothetical protein
MVQITDLAVACPLFRMRDFSRNCHIQMILNAGLLLRSSIQRNFLLEIGRFFGAPGSDIDVSILLW